jgi:hypothetical protein
VNPSYWKLKNLKQLRWDSIRTFEIVGGIFHAQPLILNDQRQAGAAIEGVIRHEELDIAQLAVDIARKMRGPLDWNASKAG